MISTMPKSGSAPTSPNALPGGLGAILQQPGAAPKGASSRSIQSILDTARKMSDMQLSDVLAGKSLDVPQYVAMTEAMGRKSLRNAVQGAQAQQQARQPSVKDKLLAEDAQAQAMQQMAAVDQMGNAMPLAGGGAIDMNENAGIASLPAPNMESVDMADGGIIAFQNRGAVEDEYSGPQVSGFDKKLWNAIKEKFGEWNQPWGKTVDASPAEVRGAMTGKNLVSDKTKSATPEELDAIARGQGVFPEGSPALPSASLVAAPAGGPTQAQRDAFYEKAAPKKTGIAAVLDGETEPKKAADDYLAKLAGIGDKTRAGIAGLKNEAQSQMLFDAMSSLLGNRNLAEAGSKFGQLAAGRIGSMGKEGRSLEKEANEYDLNLAKYREAVESGDKDRAVQIKKMMLENQSRMAMLNKPGEAVQLLNLLGDPKMMERYIEMNAAKKPVNVVSKDTALKEWGDMLPSQKRAYGNDFNAFYSAVSNSTMGAGTPVKFLGFEK